MITEKTFVVIVTYNSAKWIRKCLSSLADSVTTLEILVIDNASTDSSKQIIQNEYSSVILIEQQENLGFGQANNIGIRWALEKGATYVFLLNQDTWILPDTVANLIKVSRTYNDFYILSPVHLNGDGTRLDSNFSMYVCPDKCEEFYSDFVVRRNQLKDVYQVNFVNAAFWLIPRNCLLNVGGFDPIFPHYGEDEDFSNRVLFHGYKIGIVPNSWGYHDRNQQPFKIENLDVNNRYKRRKINYLLLLKNINNNFLDSCLIAIVSFIKECLKLILTLKYKFLVIECKAFITVLVKLNIIIKNRTKSKVIGPAFLNNMLSEK